MNDYPIDDIENEDTDIEIIPKKEKVVESKKRKSVVDNFDWTNVDGFFERIDDRIKYPEKDSQIQRKSRNYL